MYYIIECNTGQQVRNCFHKPSFMDYCISYIFFDGRNQ
nr:MAG TPA: hypothetical protein [Caudoviricetes sp.]